jgi:lipopolysaccharide export system protein LptA
MSFQPVKLLWLLCLGLLTLSPALAQGNDRHQPIHIQADRLTVDERHGVSRYQGNVHLVQGSLEISGDDLQVFLDQGQVQRILIKGNPATLQQQPEDNSPLVHSAANKMEYFADSGRLLLIENATVKQGGNHFSGERIEYDTFNSVVTASKDPDTDSGRVRAIIEPRQSAPATRPEQP